MELKALQVTKYVPPQSPVSCPLYSPKVLEKYPGLHWQGRKRSGSGDTDLLSEHEEDIPDLSEQVELECSICWAELKEGDAIITLPCNDQHRFHESCIGEVRRSESQSGEQS